jgi:hypothetical protein
MIKAKIKSNGTLLITADNEGRNELKQSWLWADAYVAEELHKDNFDFVLPEWVGALTSSPIITNDLCFNNNGVPDYVGDTWWFPNYMITDPWEELKNKGRVVFTPEENNKTLRR